MNYRLSFITWFLLIVSYNIALFSDENHSTLDDYISTYKSDSFKYDYKKNSLESNKIRNSWILPLNVNYSYSKSNPYTNEQVNEKASIRMNQPIFKSGGIYYNIKFANASKNYNDLSIDVAKRKMIKDTIATLIKIKQSDLLIKKQKLLIKNSNIDLLQKKEQYLNGQLDSGFLDNAIIKKNIVKSTLYDMQTNKERLIDKFSTLSDLDYKNAKIPNLKMISKDEFLNHNIYLKQIKSEVDRNRYAKNMKITKYLPSLSINAGYNWQKNSNQIFQVGRNLAKNSNELHYYDYGFMVSIPIDINTFKDVESSKVDYLKSKLLTKDRKKEIVALYNQEMHNIENFDKKILLSRENIKLYDKLLDDTKRLYKSGYKTEYDVNTLANSLEIQKINTKIYELDKDLELLNLYEMYIKR